MNQQLADFYFNIALDTAREEYGRSLGDAVWQPTNCVAPTRAEAIALGAPTSQELEHLSQCRLCSCLVQKFTNDSAEKLSPIKRLVAALKAYGKSTEQLVQDWIGRAQTNARIFSHGFGELAFEAESSQIPRRFEIDDFVLDLDLREETGQFVVEASSVNDVHAGQLVTVVLLGGTGEEERVPIHLNGRKGRTCYGSGVVPGRAADVVKKLGPLIIPIVLPNGRESMMGQD
jgi:hypothetical protein